MYGGSKLGDDINAGLDPHIETAHRLSGPSWDTADAAARKLGRQYAKAVNFGLPGGLGAAKFALYAKRSFGLDLTLEEARALRNLALELEPALRRYLEDAGTDRKLKLAARNLGLTLPQLLSALEAWRDEEAGEYHGGLAAKRLRAWIRGDRRFTLPEPPNFNREYDLFRDTTAVYTGRVRGRASYTEAHNTPFQGLVADGAKLALWSLRQAHAQNSALWSPVAFVHDSFLIECAPIATDTATQVLSSCMIAGLSAVCPDITIGVDIVGPMATWGPMTDSTGKVK
jgi:DNA polymerase I-like protein with 3'-5' exonuclease and polymerase domains